MKDKMVDNRLCFIFHYFFPYSNIIYKVMNGMKLEKSYFIAKEKKEDKEKTKFYAKKMIGSVSSLFNGMV